MDARRERLVLEFLNVLAMAGILALAASLRLDGITASIYGDEISSYERSQETIAHTLATHSYPLADLLVKASLLLGDSEAALRFPALAAGLLGILAMYGFLRAAHSRTAGLTGAMMMAVNPFHLFHSQWARYYTLLMLFTILALWCLYRVLSRGRARDWILYAVSMAGALLSHICFLPAFAALKAAAGLCLLVRPPGGSTRRARVQALVTLGVAALVSAGYTIYAVSPSQTMLQPGGMESIGQAPDAESDPAVAGDAGGAPAVGIQVHPADGRGLGGGLTLRNPATGVVRYQLTIYDCVEYMKRYFWTDTPWVWPLLTFLGLLGLFDALYRRPRLGVLLAAGMLSPVPLFFVTAGHWYHPRYFSFLFVIAVALIAFGLLAIARFLARVVFEPGAIGLYRPQIQGESRVFSRTNAGTAIVAAVMLVALAPKATEALATYPVDGYLPRGELSPVKHPLLDWKSLYRVMGKTIQPGDPIHHVSPQVRDAARYRPYYLPRYTKHAAAVAVYPETYGPMTPGALQELASRYPDRTIWFTGDFWFNAYEYRSFFSQANAVEINFLNPEHSIHPLQRYGALLWVLGAPTQNLVDDGGFEGPQLRELPPGIERTWAEEAYTGDGAMRIHRAHAPGGREANTEQRVLSFPLLPTRPMPRNAGFEAVDGDLPLHWHANEPSRVRADLLGDAPGGRRVLTLEPSTGAVVVRQGVPMGLAPGRTLRIEATVSAASHGQLVLAATFMQNGVPGEVTHACEGGEGWRPETARLSIPGDTDPASIAVEIRRMPGTPGEVRVDDIRLALEVAGNRLDPLQTYSASMMVKTDAVRNSRGSTVHPAAEARISWTGSDGRRQFLPWAAFGGTRDWTFLRSAPIEPGVDVPLDATDLRLEVGLFQGSGTLWVDNVQFEPRAAPSPFTDGVRLPHDETIAAAAGQLTPVTVAWE